MLQDQINLFFIKRLSEDHPKGAKLKVGDHSRRESIVLLNCFAKAIILIGGFGGSEYLKKCLVKAHPDISVIQPPDTWSAVMK